MTRACRGRERASKRASAAASEGAGSPSRRPRPGISTGQTWMLGGSSMAHLARARCAEEGLSSDVFRMLCCNSSAWLKYEGMLACTGMLSSGAVQ